MKSFIVLVLIAGISNISEAKNHKEKGPCRQLVKACKAAGFAKGQEGKRLYVDCVEKLLEGQAVEGVAVDAAQIEACKTKKSERQKGEN